MSAITIRYPAGRRQQRPALAAVLAAVLASPAAAQTATDYTLEPGHPSLQGWLLPGAAPHPADNAPTAERIELGRTLFFDPRIGRDGNMSCATCHNPALGWSDGLPTARGANSRRLRRATPTIVNSAFNFLQMWDGRKKSLEHQALGPMESPDEMDTDFDRLFLLLEGSSGYREAFRRAYPGEPIGRQTVAKALAAFERTVISNDSPFDRWVRGDATAMSDAQVRGFRVFLDEEKGNCAVCHSGPNFTDDGFHNLGLASFDDENPDVGRFSEKPLPVNKGAFKTPTLRDVARTAPYFHDGSAATLAEVVDHYVDGGVATSNLSPDMKPLTLTPRERRDLLAFLQALTSEPEQTALPVLPMVDPEVARSVYFVDDSRVAQADRQP